MVAPLSDFVPKSGLLVRNVAAATAARLKKKAKAAGNSVNDIARDALDSAARPSKDEIWTDIDRVRKRIGPVRGDSTAGIRQDRDSS